MALSTTMVSRFLHNHSDLPATLKIKTVRFLLSRKSWQL